jgi:hypothetical protein
MLVRPKRDMVDIPTIMDPMNMTTTTTMIMDRARKEDIRTVVTVILTDR